MTTSFSKFFIIELLHEYFLNRKCDGLQIIPSVDCKVLAKKMGILFRQSPNCLLAFIKDNGSNSPFINTESDLFFKDFYGKTVLRFYVTMDNAQFSNYTNIEDCAGIKKKFYFTNLSKNVENGMHYLTVPIKEFVNGTTYLPGEFAKDPISGNVFEAIKKQVGKKKNQFADDQLWIPKGLLYSNKKIEEFKTGTFYQVGDLVKNPASDDIYESVKKYSAGSKTQLNDTSLWIQKGQGQLQYVSNEDLVEYSNSNYYFKVAGAIKKAEISLLKFNYDQSNPGYNVQIGENKVMNFPQAVNGVNINLSTLDAGKYAIKINKETRLIYYDPHMPDRTMGVIEIFNHLSEKDDFSLLNDKEKLKGIHYQVQFCTRSVLWKYIRKDGRASSIVDTGDTGYIFNLNGDAFVSATPIPLSQSVLKTLKLDFNTKDFSMSPLPNPGVQHLGNYTQNEYDYLCSEIFLNY